MGSLLLELVPAALGLALTLVTVAARTGPSTLDETIEGRRAIDGRFLLLFRTVFTIHGLAVL